MRALGWAVVAGRHRARPACSSSATTRARSTTGSRAAGASAPCVVSAVAGGATMLLVWLRRYGPARATAAAAVAAVLVGWVLAQRPDMLPGPVDPRGRRRPLDADRARDRDRDRRRAADPVARDPLRPAARRPLRRRGPGRAQPTHRPSRPVAGAARCRSRRRCSRVGAILTVFFDAPLTLVLGLLAPARLRRVRLPRARGAGRGRQLVAAREGQCSAGPDRRWRRPRRSMYRARLPALSSSPAGVSPPRSSSCAASHSSSSTRSRGCVRLHVAVVVDAFGLRPALPVGALHLALDALHGRALGAVLLLERLAHLLDGKPGGLPLDAVDRTAAGDEARDHHDEKTTETQHRP